MRRTAPGFLLIALLAAAPAVAATARLAALGAGDYLEDDANALRWSGSLGDYPDRAILDCGPFNIYGGWHDEDGVRRGGFAGGIHARLGPDGAWGWGALYLDEAGTAHDPGSLVQEPHPTLVTAMLGRRLGGVLATAVLRHGGQQRTPYLGGDGPTDLQRSRTELGLGLRADLSDGAYLDVAGEARRFAEHPAYADSFVAWDDDQVSWHNFGLRARLFLRLGERTALVPLLETLVEDRPLQPTIVGEAITSDGDLRRAGCGLTFLPGPDQLVFAAVETAVMERDESHAYFDWDGGTFRRRCTTTTVHAGGESRLNPWLTLRASVAWQRRHPTRWILDPGYSPLTWDEGISDLLRMNLGAAAHLGPADLDLALSDWQGPDPWTGATGEPLPEAPVHWLSATLRVLF